MKKMGAFDVKTHLSKVLEEVQEGQEILITKRGEPMALLIPYGKSSSNTKSLISNFRKWRKNITWRAEKDGMSIKDAINQGRR